jgi:hypothetical protein
VRFLQRTVLLELRKLYVRNLAGMVSRREQLMAQIQVRLFCASSATTHMNLVARCKSPAVDMISRTAPGPFALGRVTSMLC